MASHVHSDIRSRLVAAEIAPPASRVSAFLAAAIIISIPLQPLAVVQMSAGKLTVTWLMVFTALAMLDALVTALMRPGLSLTPKKILGAAAACILLMLPGALFTSEGASGYLAYINFVVGVLAGVRVGTVWASVPRESLNIIDWAMFGFVIATVAELFGKFSGAAGLQTLHQNSSTPWGNSNYVAGVLVVTGLIIIGRAHLMQRGRWVPYLVASAGFVAAVLTLSRGGVTALAVGTAAALWVLPKSPFSKFFLRLGALSLPVLAWFAVDVIQAQRAQVNAQVYENVDTRFGLWSLAWQAFLDSPLVGSGWAHFRTISANLEVQTFAHNLFLSFGQVGGLLFGLPVVLIMIVLAVKSGRRAHQLAPALIALFAIAQTDPYTEGTVGGITLWLAIAFAFTVPTTPTEDLGNASPPKRSYVTPGGHRF